MYLWPFVRIGAFVNRLETESAQSDARERYPNVREHRTQVGYRNAGSRAAIHRHTEFYGQ